MHEQRTPSVSILNCHSYLALSLTHPFTVTDPCDVARKESMKCLDKNNYNREACSDFFRNYRECKKTWLDQRREDRRNGLDASG